ncbi:putative fluoride ion transporter CrcB [Vulcanimicrobium alpinum]|uniref:Fluoride-specific ion channel FluC n=1 Tax=Vulcanimicrobium alpinum TaxID=3016050 RepID=A0AAN1Y104_UNVUL|nr:CrcB family protein [Vulcanimicrobium alpinum]BDE08257.1 putative fluoride ion transporter CrcB [Vulcanimicrobium alpinum]
MDPRAMLAVGAGAAIGGVGRLLVTEAVVARVGAGFGHYATFFINVSGAFLIGVVLALAQSRTEFNPLLRLFLATGILGGYTTFSTFSFEVFNLATGGFVLTSIVYAVGSVALGVIAAFLGVTLVRAIGV